MVLAACGNTAPDAPCADGSIITTEQRDEAKAFLFKIVDALELSSDLADAGDAANALETMQQINRAMLEFEKKLKGWGVE